MDTPNPLFTPRATSFRALRFMPTTTPGQTQPHALQELSAIQAELRRALSKLQVKVGNKLKPA